MELLRRLQHALKRRDALIAILRGKIINFLLKNRVMDGTEIQYLKEGNFKTGLVKRSSVSFGINVNFYSDVKKFSHTFSPRDTIILKDAVLNSRTGTIWAESRSTKTISLISESTEWPNQNVLVKHAMPKLNKIKVIDRGKIGLSNEGFFHWLQEDFPKIGDLNNDRKFLQFEKMNKLNKEVLEYFKSPYELVPEWVRVKELEFESRGKDVGYLHPFQLERLKEISNKIIEEDVHSPNKIYVSRLNQRRSANNEKNLIDLLLNFGFYIFDANKLGFFDQIKLFANPKIVLGIHGAGLSHALWNNKTCLVELMPQERINRCFEWQSLLNANKYLRIDFSNGTLDIENIQKILGANDFL